MKLNKLVAMVLALAMVLSMAACTETPADPSGSSTPSTSTPATDPKPTDPKPTDPVVPDPVVTDGDVSIDFEDGNYGFVALYEGRANADASTMEVVEQYGNKALKITNGSGKVPYVAIDVVSLLGENAANVRTVEMTLGIENPDGKFYACSGNLMLWTADKLSSTTYGWSVYLESKNPKTAVFSLKDYEAFSAENPVAVLTLDTDNGATAGAANASLYIFNISFKDADGNLLTADSSATFTAPTGFSGEKDMSNLKYLAADATAIESASGVSGGAWGQTDVASTADLWQHLMVPGAVIEIEYSSTSGDIWLVLPDATLDGAGKWFRVNSENGISVSYNNSKNIAQVTYEQIAAVLGDDVTTWGARMQCESSGDWEVYSVKVGQDTGLVNVGNQVAIEGSAVTGGAWGQTDVAATADLWQHLMVPGAVLQIEYTSTTGDIWFVLPDATLDGAAKWFRVNSENGITPAYNGSVCQVTYEQIAAVLGDDVSTWGARLQCESSGDWEVFSVSVCNAMTNTVNNVLIEGSAVTGGAWAQTDVAATADLWQHLMVPGAVITIQYQSTTGDIWPLLPDATLNGAAKWFRINSENGIIPVWDGSTCQVTYEQIAAVLGDDVTTWGARMQCESSGDWEVYSVSIGMAN